MVDSGVMTNSTTQSMDGGERIGRNIRFSDAEWDWVHDQAVDRDMTASALIRLKVLQGMPKDNPNATAGQARRGE